MRSGCGARERASRSTLLIAWYMGDQGFGECLEAQFAACIRKLRQEEQFLKRVGYLTFLVVENAEFFPHFFLLLSFQNFFSQVYKVQNQNLHRYREKKPASSAFTSLWPRKIGDFVPYHAGLISFSGIVYVSVSVSVLYLHLYIFVYICVNQVVGIFHTALSPFLSWKRWERAVYEIHPGS